MISAGFAELKLPPVDVFRRPFVEPLGHLVLVASEADNALIDFLTDLHPTHNDEVVAAKVRFWNEEAHEFVKELLESASPGPEWLAEATAWVARFTSLRLSRHRVIHDAIEPGLFERVGGGYEARPIRVGFLRHDKTRSNLELAETSPEEVAALALNYYDLISDLAAVHGALGSG